MKNTLPTLALFVFLALTVKAQDQPCSHVSILERHLIQNPDALLEIEKNEAFIKSFIMDLRAKREDGIVHQATYNIPVVLHVFHFGDDGKIDMEQALSGMEILNNDFKGLNEDWDSIAPAFDSIKAALDIEFCLATIDPDGNPTTGVLYYEDEQAMLNNTNLFQYAWDNYKYLNIYLPKYTGGAPSLFTAYAYYPSTSGSNNNSGGIFYSSIRWGYGTHSELDPGQEWASVGTHEMGHWLNLRHTFENGCNVPGDFVDDTPYTTGSGIELMGCNNNDFSCAEATNGENYMDYNHDCKKMFTQGQVDRMTAALNLPSRFTLWSEENLIETGCSEPISSTGDVSANELMAVYPNPASQHIHFKFKEIPLQLSVYDGQGRLVDETTDADYFYELNVSYFNVGIYFYRATFEKNISSGNFIVE